MNSQHSPGTRAIFRRFLAYDLGNPSGYVVICLLGVLGLALFVTKF